MRKTVRCHQSHRFFTLCHIAISRLSHKAFLPPFRMTIGGKGIIMRWTLSVIRKRMWRIYDHGEESGKLSSKVIDSSLCATVPLFPVFSTQHSYLRSEWRFWESTSLTMGNRKRHDDGERKASSKANAKDLYLWWGKLVRRHPERMWRIYYP